MDQLTRLEKKKQEVQKVLGVGGPTEEIKFLADRLDSIEQQIGGSPHSKSFEDFPESASPAAQVAWLVENTDMDSDDAKEWVEDNKDPEVMDIEFKRDKFHRRQELFESAIEEVNSTLREVFGGWEEGVGDRLYENITGDESTAERQQSQRSHSQRGRGAERPVQGRSDGGTPATAAAPDSGEPGPEVLDCPECGGNMLVRDDFKQCQNPACMYGVAPCDRCGESLELPPVGTADFGVCPGSGCKNMLEVPADPDATLDCETCGWNGAPTDISIEAIECNNCEEIRPITRNQQQVQEVNRLGLQ